jgi:membrane associated rhomboid family serine protease
VSDAHVFGLMIGVVVLAIVVVSFIDERGD